MAPLPAVRTEELHSIRGELSQIKAQVDSLLESLEHMDQLRDRSAGQAPKGGPRPCSQQAPAFPASEDGRVPRVLPGVFPVCRPPFPGVHLPSTPFGCSCDWRMLVASGLFCHPHRFSSYLEPEQHPGLSASSQALDALDQCWTLMRSAGISKLGH